MRPDTLLAILAMAVASYAVRAGGLVLGNRLPRTGKLAQWLREVPAAILISIVAPEIARGGPAALLGSAVTGAVMVTTRNLFLSIAGGVLAVYGARTWLHLA